MAKAYPTRKLGPNGPVVSAIGLGAGSNFCVPSLSGTNGISGVSGTLYSKTDKSEAFAMLSHAADCGVTFWDTSDYYASERIIGEWLARTGRRSEIFLATKFGGADLRQEPNTGIPCSEPSYVKLSVQRSLKMLQTEYIDLYYQHRVDPAVPIEVVLEALRPFVERGQIRWLGLSECSAATLRRAKSVPGLGEKIIAVQMEYSPFGLGIETDGVLEAANETGMAVVAYSPLGRGLITGRYRSPADFEEGDMRRMLPRFSSENFPKNLELLAHFEALAAKYAATPSQIALAWILAQHPNFVPIPGTRSVARLEENAGSAEIRLTSEDVENIRKRVEEADVHGARYEVIPQGDCIGLDEWKA
ncbi:NADP-dependent oxidoreductase domain-containing protein [Mycena rosella]|uniref:NADP-dependent oxidoreductase domain-containing protein n=1 Tax=Mycena rosella TaxID=1033263 RepID=A0AAD7DBU3_MYCRO|nr:NADP-dependent oxidoreductase domain-containing protein [Mycena rosella]